MVKSRKLQWSFAGGELSPEMYGHVDDASFQIGVAKAKNVFIKPSGALQRRPGLEYQANTKGDGYARLIPFVYSTADTLIVELGEEYFRFFDSSGAVDAYSGNPRTWQSHVGAATTTANSPLLSAAAFTEYSPATNLDAWALGDRVWIQGSVRPFGFPNVNYYIVAIDPGVSIEVSTSPGGGSINAIDAGTVAVYRAYTYGDVVKDSGSYICLKEHVNQATSTTEYWYLLTGTELEIPNKYKEDHIPEIQYTQSADVLTLTHPMYPVTELRRYGPTGWAVAEVTFGSELPKPATPTVVETYGRRFDVLNVTLSGSDYLFTAHAPHDLSEGDAVFVSGNSSELSVSTGPSPLTDNFLIASSVSGSTLKLKTTDTGKLCQGTIGTYAADSIQIRFAPLSADSDNVYAVTAVNDRGVESNRSDSVTASDNLLYVDGSYNTISWTPVPGAVRYNVYKEQDGLFGYIGQEDDVAGASGYSFVDDNIAPDLGITPPIEDNAISIVSKTSVSVDSSLFRFTWLGHPLSIGDPIWFDTIGIAITGMSDGQRFFVAGELTPSEFQISETVGGSVFEPDQNTTCTAYTGNFPGAVAYFEQRRCFAGARQTPQGLWMTRTGTESDMRYSLPVRSDDRVSVGISSRQASTIRHIIPLDHLLLMTSSAEYRVTPLNDDAITPTSISVRPQTYIGSSTVRPVIANNTVVFCAARGGHVREMGYQAAAQGFTTGDLSLRAAHLFDDYEITQADQMKAPHSILWFASSSNNLLSLTYIPEESVGGWSWHDTNSGTDEFVSVAVIPEGDEDRVWVVVDRGGTHMVEKMSTQAVSSIEDSFFVDSGTTFNGANTILDGTWYLTLSGSSYAANSLITITAGGAAPEVATTFSDPADVGDAIVMTDPSSGIEVTITITSVTSGQVAVGTCDVAIPAPIQNANNSAWAYARRSFAGLTHLDTKSCAVLADGVVLANHTIASNTLTLTTPAVKVTVGLPYTSEIQTMPFTAQTEAFAQGMQKNVNEMWLRVYKSAPFEVGPSTTCLSPSDPYSETLGTLHTGEIDVTLLGDWTADGQIVIRQSNPLPLTVVSATAQVTFGGN